MSDDPEALLAQYHTERAQAVLSLRRARDAARALGWITTTRFLRRAIEALSAIDSEHANPRNRRPETEEEIAA